MSAVHRAASVVCRISRRPATNEVCGLFKRPVGSWRVEKELTTYQVAPVPFGIVVAVAGGVRPFVVAQISDYVKLRPRISRLVPIARN